MMGVWQITGKKAALVAMGMGEGGCSVAGRSQGRKEDRHTCNLCTRQNRQMSCFQQPGVLSGRWWAWGAVELAQLMGETVPKREPLG